MKDNIRDEHSGGAPAGHVILKTEGGSTTVTVAEWEAEKAKRDARHALGYYTMEEAAEVMAAAHGFDAENYLRRRMHPAVAEEKLKLIDENDGLPVSGANRPIRYFADWVTPESMNKWLRESRSIYLWPEEITSAQPSAFPTAPQPLETKEQRQDRRLKLCEDAGLQMPSSALGRMPNGIDKVANVEGVTRQTFTSDVKAALLRRSERQREGCK